MIIVKKGGCSIFQIQFSTMDMSWGYIVTHLFFMIVLYFHLYVHFLNDFPAYHFESAMLDENAALKHQIHVVLLRLLVPSDFDLQK